MLIGFDFDGTLAKTTLFHRLGWERVLAQLDLDAAVGDVFPVVPGLRERFDSYPRIRRGFLADGERRRKIEAYFSSTDVRILARRLMDMKESFTLAAIADSSPGVRRSLLAGNIVTSLCMLKQQRHALCVISSSRESVITNFLYANGLLDFFTYIVGEESLTDGRGRIRDKPEGYAAKVLRRKGAILAHYVGDDPVMDGGFAEAAGVAFTLADYRKDFLEIVERITYGQ
jgi:phosphoglycolate phosphatase-like HAD superfamily hydrolase